MKIIVAGSREYFNYEFVKSKIDHFTKNLNRRTISILSGCCGGVDELGMKYAKEKGILLKEFPADWTKYGNAAGPIRNEEMAKYADAAIVFWDGKSKGSKDMIERAKAHKIILRIVPINA